MGLMIVPESNECLALAEGGPTVAVVKMHDDGAVEHLSCWPTLEAAAAEIARLEAVAEAEDDDTEVETGPEVDDLESPEEGGLGAIPSPGEGMGAPEMASATVKVDVQVDGMSELERAAALADKVRDALGLLSTLDGNVFAVDEPVDNPAEAEEFTAIAGHSTGFSDDAWDGPANEVNVRSPEAEDYFANVYAWRDDTADTSVKAAYRFIHHFVGPDGRAGAASTIACSTGIGVLNGGRGGTTIPAGDRQGVYNHLARHLREADREPPVLMSQEAYEAALQEANLQLAAELETPASDGGLAGLEDEALIAELARRWATDLVGRLRDENLGAEPVAESAEFGEPLVEIEVEITKAEEEEDEGEAEECCPMCEGSGAVQINGLTAQCPMCGGSGVMGEGYEMAATDAEPQVEVEGSAPVAPSAGIVVPDADPIRAFDWEGVLIVEGIPSGDGRMIAENALTWRELPIPLMLQTVNASGHDGAVIAGSIHEITREGQNIVGRGYFDSGEAGQEAQRLLAEGTMRGVSADIDSVIVDFMTVDGESVAAEDLLFGGVEALEVLTAGRIMGATLTPFPAFQEAFVTVLMDDEMLADEVLVAAGAEPLGAIWRVPSQIGAWVVGQGDAEAAVAALVASVGATVEVPASPSREWFLPGNMVEPEPFTVHPDGRCYGLVARWGSCHIGFTDRCVQVPRSGSAYKHFRNKTVLTAEGELVATGPIFMDTVHPNLRLVASDAQAFYADTGCAVADVALYENEHGIVAAGALRPGLTPEQVRRFRGSDVSPDWRTINGRLEVVGLLSVNVSGFIVEGLVASGGASSAPRGVWDSVRGEVTALVAAGMLRHADAEREEMRRAFDVLAAEVAELREAIRPMRAERAAAALEALRGAQFVSQPEVEVEGEQPSLFGCGDGACQCGGACGG